MTAVAIARVAMSRRRFEDIFATPYHRLFTISPAQPITLSDGSKSHH